jgi:uncharacterized protein (TIGR03083 family)
METDEVWRYVDSERAALAELLSGLSAFDWDTPSVCPGWTVRDVAAHVISSPQARVWPVVTGMIRTRGDFNRFVLEDAKRLGAQYSGEEIVAQYREFEGSRRHPPGTTPVDPLLDVLIHTQDIALPLGLERRMPVEAARAAADRIWRKSFPFKAQKRLAGLQLVASDIDWKVGEGTEIHGPMEALLLLVSGRKTSNLSGAGVTKL